MKTLRYAFPLTLLVLLYCSLLKAEAAAPAADQPTVTITDGFVATPGKLAPPSRAAESGGPDEVMMLQYDSGNPVGFFDYPGGAGRFTPPAPCRILAIELYPIGSGSMELHIWRNDGGQKPDRLPGGDLMPPMTVSVTADTWNRFDLTAPITIDPPRDFFVGQFNATAGGPHIQVDDGVPESDYSRLNLYGDLDSGHPGENRWVIVGEVDPGTGPKQLRMMVRVEIDTFNEITEFRFEDVSAAVGFSPGSRYAWGDYNADGHEDLLVNGRTLLESSGPPDWTFSDVSAAKGVGGPYNGGLWADYDNDGDLDFYSTAGLGNADALWQNGGPPDFTFTDVTASVGNPSDGNPTEACGWGDYDADGDVDLYVVGSEDWNSGSPVYYEDYLYQNTGPPDYDFVDVSVSAGIRVTPESKYGRGVAWYDYDKDGWPDVFISDYRLHENLFLENRQDGTFANIAPAKGMQGLSPTPDAFGHSIGSAWGDMDNDGEMDLFVANLAHSNWLDWSDTSKLYMNQGPPAYDFVDLLGLTETNRLSTAGIYYNETHSDPSLIDYNGDGFLDVFVTCVYRGWPSELYMSNGDPSSLAFTFDNYPSGLVVDNGWGAGWCDYDQDGDLDVAARDSETGGGFFLNNSNSASRTLIPNWLGVELIGVAANRAAIGSTITLHYPGGIQLREVVSGRGTGNGDSFVQHFGLGAETSVDRLEIDWLGGCGVQTVSAPALNQVLVIQEDCTPGGVEVCRGLDITVPPSDCTSWDPATGPYRDAAVVLSPGECMYYDVRGTTPGTALLWKEMDDVLLDLQ